MGERPRDTKREERLQMEIIADAYGPEEQATSWHLYLEETLQFPFRAQCIAERLTSPLRLGEEVEVTGMAPDEVCEHEMFLLIAWTGRELAVPLAQLEGVAVDEQTQQAIDDWHYWVDQGYTL
jgi:hypothetical protein